MNYKIVKYVELSVNKNSVIAYISHVVLGIFKFYKSECGTDYILYWFLIHSTGIQIYCNCKYVHV